MGQVVDSGDVLDVFCLLGSAVWGPINLIYCLNRDSEVGNYFKYVQLVLRCYYNGRFICG